MNNKDPEMAATLKEAVNAYVSTGKLLKLADLEVSHLPPTVIPSASICYHAKKLSENNTSMRSSNDAGGGSSGWLNSGISKVFERRADNLSKSLTTAKKHELIANTIKFRDEAQNGMTCKEVIQLLVQLTGGSAKSCENHYDWMIWKPRVHVEAIECETKRAADGSLLHVASEDMLMLIIGTSLIMLHSSMVQGQEGDHFWCQVRVWMLR
jgi:hypothetical protein